MSLATSLASLALAAATDSPARLEAHGFVDTVFAYNFNRPADHANFFPGTGTSAKRDDEVTINAQVAYSSGKTSLSLNGIVGPERTDNDDDVRALADLVGTYKATPTVTLGLSVDVAREGRAAGDAATWKGVGVYARFAPPGSRTAAAFRSEHYQDEDGAISGIAQTLHEITATLEHRPVERLIIKLEGRYDRSTAPAFATSERDPDGAPVRRGGQFLLLMAAVAAF